MADNKENKFVRYSDFSNVHCSQFKEFNCEQELTPIQSRLYYLMVFGKQPRTENESLYGWTNRLGLPKSTTYGLFTKRNQNMHLASANKLAEGTGASVDWIQKGIGEPFLINHDDETIDRQAEGTYDGLVVGREVSIELDTSLLIQAFETLDNALKVTGRTMQPAGRARFVATVYASLKENEDMDTQLLEDCVFTIEESLKSTRRSMSPKSKTDLILIIYELYSGNASYKEAMKSTINNLIRSVS